MMSGFFIFSSFPQGECIQGLKYDKQEPLGVPTLEHGTKKKPLPPVICPSDNYTAAD